MLVHLFGLRRLNINKCYKQVLINSIRENTLQKTPGYILFLQLVGKDIFIPIDLDFESGRKIITIQEKELFARPHIYDTLRRTIYALGASPKAVLIAMYLDGIFYAFVQVEKDNKLLEIDVKFSDAISTALTCKIPILIEEKLAGIKGINLKEEIKRLNLDLIGI